MFRCFCCILMCASLTSGAYAQAAPNAASVKDLSPSADSITASPVVAQPKVMVLEEVVKRKPLRFIEVQDLPSVASEPLPTAEELIDPNLPAEGRPPISQPMAYVVLNGIRKMTGRREPIEGDVGDVLRFAELEVVAHQCRQVVDRGQKGYAALLDIRHASDATEFQPLFRGWLFSTTPSLSSIGHPLYDLLLDRCQAKPAAEPAKKDTAKKE